MPDRSEPTIGEVAGAAERHGVVEINGWRLDYAGAVQLHDDGSWTAIPDGKWSNGPTDG